MASLNASFMRGESVTQFNPNEDRGQGVDATSMFDLIHHEDSDLDGKDGFSYKNTTAGAAIFHFKVMELKTIEDFENDSD